MLKGVECGPYQDLIKYTRQGRGGGSLEGRGGGGGSLEKMCYNIHRRLPVAEEACYKRCHEFVVTRMSVFSESSHQIAYKSSTENDGWKSG